MLPKSTLKIHANSLCSSTRPSSSQCLQHQADSGGIRHVQTPQCWGGEVPHSTGALSEHRPPGQP